MNPSVCESKLIEPFRITKRHRIVLWYFSFHYYCQSDKMTTWFSALNKLASHLCPILVITQAHQVCCRQLLLFILFASSVQLISLSTYHFLTCGALKSASEWGFISLEEYFPISSFLVWLHQLNDSHLFLRHPSRSWSRQKRVSMHENGTCTRVCHCGKTCMYMRHRLYKICVSMQVL